MATDKDILLLDTIDKSVWKYNKSKFHVKTLESGLHSDLYMNTDCIVSDVTLVESIVKNVFVKALNARKIKPDWIISYPPFGLAIAYALARQIGAKFGYVDTKNLECNFDILKNDTVIVIGDDIYSGESIKKTIQIVTAKGASVKAPIFTIGNFTGTEIILSLDVVSAISERGHLYKEKECPMCKSGSKAVSPRMYWHELTKRM
jgi:orotate phosphoribosyltransferase